MALGIIPSLFRVLNSVKEDIKIKSSNYFACNAVKFGLISLIPAQKQMNNQEISCFEKRRHSVLRMSSFIISYCNLTCSRSSRRSTFRRAFCASEKRISPQALSPLPRRRERLYLRCSYKKPPYIIQEKCRNPRNGALHNNYACRFKPRTELTSDRCNSRNARCIK